MKSEMLVWPSSRYCAVARQTSILSWRPSQIWPATFRDNRRVIGGSFCSLVIADFPFFGLENHDIDFGSTDYESRLYFLVE